MFNTLLSERIKLNNNAVCKYFIKLFLSLTSMMLFINNKLDVINNPIPKRGFGVVIIQTSNKPIFPNKI